MSKISVHRAGNEWEQTFNALPDLIAIIGMDHRIIRVNKAMAERLGMSPGKCIGQPCYRLMHGMDTMPDLCPHARLLKDASAHTSEIHEDHLNGDFFVTASPLFDEKGTLTGCVHVMRDITERRRVERALRHSEQQLRNIVEHSTNTFYSHTPDHVLTYVSPRVRQLLGYEPDEVMIKWTGLASDDPINQQGFQLTQKAIDTGQRQPPYRLEFLKKDGEKVWVEVNESPVVKDGKTTAIVGSLTDINERTLVQSALAESEQRFQTILDSLNDAITIHDLTTGAILYVNQRLCELSGYTREDAARLNVAALSSGEHPYTAREALKWLRKAAEGTPQIVEWHVKDKNGRLFWVEVNMRRAIIGGQDCIIVAARDITDRRGIENALKENERRLRLITNNMLDLITVAGLNMNVEYISPSHKQVLGYEPEELVKQWSIEFIHPDDREKVMQSIRGILAAGKHEAMEFRLRHADGHYLWLETVGSLILDDNGEKVGIVFSSRDITERMRSSQSLRDSEGKYREILDSIDDGYYEVDLAGRFNFFNDVLPRFLGYTHEELMSTNFKTAMDEENVKKVFEVFHQVYVTGVPSRLVEFESKRKDGSRAYVESSVFLIRNVEGTPVGFRGVVRDITERKQFQDRLQTMAITDQLTGLFNRRGFITLTEQQLKAADRSRKKVLIAFIDLDGMKHINDVWGHEEGDKALITAAKLLKQAFRESDIIARVGGDEFAVLAPDVADTMQDVFISRLRQQTDAHNLGEDGAYRLTMSVGSTFYDPNDPCSLDELMSRADRLMYEDKRRKVA